MEEFLPGVRADGVAEKRVVGAALDAIGAAVLDIGPARRQVGDAVDIVEHDGGIAQRRPDNAISAAGQRRDQRLQAVARQHGLFAAPRSGGVVDGHDRVLPARSAADAAYSHIRAIGVP